jgi:hypothetical protein
MSLRFETIDFGPEFSAPISMLQLEWFDLWLKGVQPKTGRSPLRLFVMGANQWRDEREWPLARAGPVPYYLSEGALETAKPTAARRLRFTYDPANPVPTAGGPTCCNPKIFAWGPMDQREIESRKDVLVFNSRVLDQDVEVTGPIRTHLYVSTSVQDTDFTAKLVDVYPDGRAINLTDGILRLRYRDGLENPVLAEPGKVYAIRIDTGVTSNLFKRGHRIRVEISSSNFPRFDRNLNTGRANSFETRGIVAEQVVYTGQERASHVLLPVVR